MSLSKRVVALEEKMVAEAPPLPALVRCIYCEEDRQAALAELATRPKGTKLINIITVCARKCTNGCDQGGPGCRHKLDGIDPNWQPPEADNE